MSKKAKKKNVENKRGQEKELTIYGMVQKQITLVGDRKERGTEHSDKNLQRLVKSLTLLLPDLRAEKDEGWDF